MQTAIFHLAFPVKDIESTLDFYRDQLGFSIGLTEENRCLIDFFGHQLVAHQSDQDFPDRPSMYPRHFGLIVSKESDYDKLLERCEKKNLPIHGKPTHRFEGSLREHRTFFVSDPSNNMLEFKWYKNKEYMLRGDSKSPTLKQFLDEKDLL